MPVEGRFQADFASFYDACQKAEVSLKGFEQGSAKVETSLNRMTNSLSGTKIIQDATLMTEAVERVGGVSKLTEKELARVSATVGEAAAKLRAMGQDVPPGMQKIADETKGVDKASGGLTDTVKGLALSFAAMFTARAAFNFVKSTIDEASSLKDLSQQTHINVEELQLLAGAMSDFGVDADELGKGLFTLSRKIAGGDDSIILALRKMGMSLKDVDGLNGEELFLKIMRGLTTLQGGLRDDTASEIFGSKLGMAMAGASEGIDGALESARRMSNFMSQEAVDSLDAYGESIDRAKGSLSALAANMLGPVAEGMNTLFEATNKGASKWSIFVAMTKDWAASNSITGASTTHLATLLDELNQKTDQGTAATRQTVVAHDEASAAMKRREAAAESMTKAEIAAAKKLADDWIKIFDDMRVTGLEGEKKFYDEMVKTATAGMERKNADITKFYEADWAMQKAYAALKLEHGSTTLQAQLAQIKTWADEQEAAGRRSGVTNQSYYDALAALSKEKSASLMTDWAAIGANSKAVLQETADKAKATYDYMSTRTDEFAPAVIEKFRQTAEAAQAAADTWAYSFVDALDEVAKKVPEVLDAVNAKVATSATSWGQAMSKVSAGLGTMTGVIQNATGPGGVTRYDDYNNPYTYIPGVNAPGKLAPGGSSGLRGFGAGGPVLEDGPIYAHAGEYVLPKGGGGGSIVINNVFQVNGTGDQVARQVESTLTRLMMTVGRKWPAA